MIFYHVDRARTINVCGELNIPFESSSPNDTIYETLSLHGKQYLLTAQPPNYSLDYELTLEHIRALKFPDKPSRFQCLFASKTKDEALLWAKKHCTTENLFHIVEIESDVFYEFDASWLNSSIAQSQQIPFTGPASSTAYYFDIANRYWSGKLTNKPEIEVLLPYPIKVIKIEDYISHISINSVVLSK